MKNSNPKWDDKKKEVDGNNFTIEEWKRFVEENEFWLVISKEIEEREALLLSYLRSGEMKNKWTDDEIRARISELDYIKTTPIFFIADITLTKEANGKES